MNFSTKLDLAVAMKLIPAADRRGYAKLNWLRNQLAHNFDRVVEERVETALRHSLSERQKGFLTQIEPMFTNPSELRYLQLRGSIVALYSSSLKSFLLAKHERKPTGEKR
jgi:hypothetical protein